MKKIKKKIAIALIGLVLTAGSTAVVYAHTCPVPFSSDGYTCWYNHGVSPITGKHVCNLNCEPM